MRMRKKKNLEQRLEDVGEYLLIPKNESLDFKDAIKEKHILDFTELFGNSNPVYLEVGCGKGGFGNEFAKRNPQINILCVEKAKNVIVSGCEQAQNENIPNIRFISCCAQYLLSYIDAKSIGTIFLNFSCPFPKKKYEPHRLTSRQFLDIYKVILQDNAPIYQKTDNMHFFEYSIESLSQNGFALSNVSLDLHNSDFEGNIETEYEKRFSSQGMPIYRLEARLKQNR